MAWTPLGAGFHHGVQAYKVEGLAGAEVGGGHKPVDVGELVAPYLEGSGWWW